MRNSVLNGLVGLPGPHVLLHVVLDHSLEQGTNI